MDEIKTQLPELTHKESIERVLLDGFVSVHLPTLERIAAIANFIAPEHLELQVNEDSIEFLTNEITTAGAFLLGHATATSLGDFVAGPSHVLPTGRSSRFSSGLRLHDFIRRSSFIHYDVESALRAKKSLDVFAEMEKLDGKKEYGSFDRVVSFEEKPQHVQGNPFVKATVAPSTSAVRGFTQKF